MTYKVNKKDAFLTGNSFCFRQSRFLPFNPIFIDFNHVISMLIFRLLFVVMDCLVHQDAEKRLCCRVLLVRKSYKKVKLQCWEQQWAHTMQLHWDHILVTCRRFVFNLYFLKRFLCVTHDLIPVFLLVSIGYSLGKWVVNKRNNFLLWSNIWYAWRSHSRTF